VHILLLTRYGRLGASSRLRSLQYIPYLREQGIDVTDSPFLSDQYLKTLYRGRRGIEFALDGLIRRLRALVHSRNFNVLWVEKELLPWLPYWIERLLLRNGLPLVVDYDDAIFHNYDLNSSPIVRSILGTKIARVMARASLVTVGNQYLGGYAERAGSKRVEILPTAIDLARYPPRKSEQDGDVNIGWIGSPSTSQYLYQVSNALTRVCRESRARVVLVGSGPMRLEGVPVQVQDWLEETEQDQVAAFDIGIMPLPDGPWERGKCGYKLIQYMACGKPVIASPVGVNCEIVEHGRNGFLAATEDEWVKYLRILVSDRELRLSMGAEGRSKVEKMYSLQATASLLAGWLREVAETNRTRSR
jgi:glycosyltransferase involved in cell wall biosynthesis